MGTDGRPVVLTWQSNSDEDTWTIHALTPMKALIADGWDDDDCDEPCPYHYCNENGLTIVEEIFD